MPRTAKVITSCAPTMAMVVHGPVGAPGSSVPLIHYSAKKLRGVLETPCWRDSTAGLQFYCNCLSTTHIIDQQSILFYKRILHSSNVILHTLFHFKQSDICSLLAKYRIPSLSLPVHVQKNYIWNHCVFSVGDDLNQTIYKSRFKSFPMTYDFDLNQFSSHDSWFWFKSNF